MVDIASIKGKKSGKQKKEKLPKIKLNKEQRKYVENLLTIENRITFCREYSKLWMKFFRFFAADIEDHEIKPEEEKAFFKVMTECTRKQFLFVELMGDTFDRGNDLTQVLCDAVSLAHIQGMDENGLAKIELDWHGLFLDMNKALGRLLRMVPCNMSLMEVYDFVEKGGLQDPEYKKKLKAKKPKEKEAA